jgi:hypothetical protein
LYEYNTNTLDATKTLNVSGKNAYYSVSSYKYYGDGSATATATSTQGQITGQGDYVTTKSLLENSILQSAVYNNFTYELLVEKEIEKYRDILLNLLHPSGLKVIGKYNLVANSEYFFHGVDARYSAKPLSNTFPGIPATVTINTNFTNGSNNILVFGNLSGGNIANIGLIANTSVIALYPANGPNLISEVASVNTKANTVTVKNNIWLTYANVAYVSSNSGSNVINIITLTGTYDKFNNGNYSDSNYPLKDIVKVSDTVSVNGTTGVVSSVDYVNNNITLTTLAASWTKTESNTLMSVNRTYVANSILNQVIIYNSIGTPYIPEITTEDGRSLITEDGQTLILG